MTRTERANIFRFIDGRYEKCCLGRKEARIETIVQACLKANKRQNLSIIPCTTTSSDALAFFESQRALPLGRQLQKFQRPVSAPSLWRSFKLDLCGAVLAQLSLGTSQAAKDGMEESISTLCCCVATNFRAYCTEDWRRRRQRAVLPGRVLFHICSFSILLVDPSGRGLL